jgi:hypothetical protein
LLKGADSRKGADSFPGIRITRIVTLAHPQEDVRIEQRNPPRIQVYRTLGRRPGLSSNWEYAKKKELEDGESRLVAMPGRGE